MEITKKTQTDSRTEGPSLKPGRVVLLLQTIPTQLIDYRDVKLVLPWSLYFYILVSLAQEGTLQGIERETWVPNQPQNPPLIICPSRCVCQAKGGIELVGELNQ